MKIKTVKKLLKKLVNNTVIYINYGKGLPADTIVCKNDSIIFHKHYFEIVRCNVSCRNIAYYRINFINKLSINI